MPVVGARKPDDPSVVVDGGVGRWTWGPELLDLLGLVVDLERHLLELVGVLLAVVGAEQEVEPAGEGDADVCLGSAPIATIGRSQLGTFDD